MHSLPALLYAMNVHQDLACRAAGRCLFGEPIDMEVGDLIIDGLAALPLPVTPSPAPNGAFCIAVTITSSPTRNSSNSHLASAKSPWTTSRSFPFTKAWARPSPKRTSRSATSCDANLIRAVSTRAKPAIVSGIKGSQDGGGDRCEASSCRFGRLDCRAHQACLFDHRAEPGKSVEIHRLPSPALLESSSQFLRGKK